MKLFSKLFLLQKTGKIPKNNNFSLKEKKFDFAFSFSGEEIRQKVIKVARDLEKLEFKVFVDKWYTKEMQKVSHPKEFLTDVFMNAKHIILVLNNKYMYMLENNYNCDKNFSPDEGCYIKHEIKIISDRFKKEPDCLIRIKTEDGRFNLNKYGINTDTLYDILDTKIILEHFEYKEYIKKMENQQDNKLQIKEKFEKLFNFHNINLEEWPLVEKEFTYDVIEKNKFYEVIKPEVIDNIIDKFKVNKQVFYNNSNEFYKIEALGFYKNVRKFSDYVYNEIYMKNGKMYILSERIPNKEKELDEKKDENRFALMGLLEIPCQSR